MEEDHWKARYITKQSAGNLLKRKICENANSVARYATRALITGRIGKHPAL
jgi:hypothetical protein